MAREIGRNTQEIIWSDVKFTLNYRCSMEQYARCFGKCITHLYGSKDSECRIWFCWWFPICHYCKWHFFDKLLEAEEVLRSLSKASFIMQHDCNTLADVLNMLGLIYQSFQKSCHLTKLLPLLEKNWKQQEQPLFLLAFFFHPKYVGMLQTMARFKRNLDITSTI